MAWWETQGQAPIVVLFYHRVSDSPSVPWTVSTGAFQRHLDWLAARFELVSLNEAQRRIAQGVNYRTAVAITFDDGYAENCEFAIPLLLQRKIPVTYFVTLGPILQRKPFAHDLRFSHPPWPNTVAQLRQMAQAGVEIGSHTHTHADLGRIGSRERLWDEVVGATLRLEDLIGQPVRWFAFPFGQWRNLHPAAFRLAWEAGLRGVCSAYGGYNFPGGDPFHLQRFGAEEDLMRIKLICSGEPRYQGRFPPFPYVQPSSSAQPLPSCGGLQG